MELARKLGPGKAASALLVEGTFALPTVEEPKARMVRQVLPAQVQRYADRPGSQIPATGHIGWEIDTPSEGETHPVAAAVLPLSVDPGGGRRPDRAVPCALGRSGRCF